MTHKHTHECDGCKHDCLHYCECCQKVYCCKCKQEWGGYSYYYPYWTTTTTDVSIGTLSDDALACFHKH